jgi:hypothetical protein
MICERTKAVGLACSSDQECDLVCLMLFFSILGSSFDCVLIPLCSTIVVPLEFVHILQRRLSGSHHGSM